jgi:sugar fermentation stimulation protein A
MGIYRPFEKIEHANFISRPNRFTILCEKDGKKILAHLPNPGRLRELLLPGRRIYIAQESIKPWRKTIYTAIAVQRDGIPVFLHTAYANRIAHYLIEMDAIPGMEGARVISSEVRIGKSRFDILLKRGESLILMEVKSCTLFGKRIAMFPDAQTERGTRHILELSKISREGKKTAVLFLVHWPYADFFMPDYHTDLHFARVFLENRDLIDFIPISIRWMEDLSLYPQAKRLHVPWEIIEREADERGSYIIILHLKDDSLISVGGLGRVEFKRGFYVYTGSAMRNLSQRIKRHKRLIKRKYWHIDFLRSFSEFRDIIIFRSSERIECQISRAMSNIAGWEVPDFGSSDCKCSSHLFGFPSDPLISSEFHMIIQYFRMDRLI